MQSARPFLTQIICAFRQRALSHSQSGLIGFLNSCILQKKKNNNNNKEKNKKQKNKNTINNNNNNNNNKKKNKKKKKKNVTLQSERYTTELLYI